MELLDPIRRGVHDGEDEEGQDGGDDEAARNGDGHRPPEDVEHERQHAEDGSSCREHDGAQAQDGGVDDGVPWPLARRLMFLDLVDEDDGVADDHAEEGEYAEVGDEAHRGVREEHGNDDANEAERRGEEGECHLAHAADLEHEQGHDDEDHGRDGFYEVVHGVVSIRECTRRDDGGTGGEVLAQFRCRIVDTQGDVVALALCDVRLDHDGREEVVPLNESILRLVGEARDLVERDAPAACGDGKRTELTEVCAVCLGEPQDNAEGAVARVELRRLCARDLSVEHLLDILGAEAVAFQLVLVKVDADALCLFGPIEMDVVGRRVGGRNGADLLGDAAHLVGGRCRDAQHDGVVRRRAGLDVLRCDARACQLVVGGVTNDGGERLARLCALCRDDELGAVLCVRLRVDGEDEARRRLSDVGDVVLDLVAVLVQYGGETIRLCLCGRE